MTFSLLLQTRKHTFLFLSAGDVKGRKKHGNLCLHPGMVELQTNHVFCRENTVMLFMEPPCVNSFKIFWDDSKAFLHVFSH